MSLLTEAGLAIAQNILPSTVDIVLWVNNGSDTIILPIVPNPLPSITENQANETFSAVTGDLKLIGEMGLREVTIDTFAPNKLRKYPFQRPLGSPSEDIKKFFHTYRVENKIPMRVFFIRTNGEVLLNMPCVVDEFSWSYDKVGDMKYSVKLVEYKFIDEKNAW